MSDIFIWFWGYMNKDFISICIITKDEEKHLLKTLEYLSKQSYWKENFEIIIVDGNSKDNTIKSSDKFLTEQGIEHTIVNEKKYENKRWWYAYGHSFARNVSIDLVSDKSKYVAQIDADCRADKYRLENLWLKIKLAEKDDKIAWAWWPRLVETEWKISKFELMLNNYFCSYIMTLWNPAFCVRKWIKYIPSIAGYNSIYKAEIIKKYMFNTAYATFFDDIEINYRLSKDWYKFLYCPEAKIWHRLDETFWQFLKHMQKYWSWAAKMTKYYKAIPRLYVHLSLCYLLYTILLIPLLFLSWIFILPYWLVFILATAVFIENVRKTKSLVSLWVYPLVFLHPLMYGWWFVREMFRK